MAFNLDFLFKKAGAHGKQSLTMAMGFGCNAAGVIATRVIDSPRERLIAILTNNFVPCNGRFPTLIMLATVFVAAAFPPAFASFAAAGSVVGVVLIGVVLHLAGLLGAFAHHPERRGLGLYPGAAALPPRQISGASCTPR